jgi:hypothetical protein
MAKKTAKKTKRAAPTPAPKEEERASFIPGERIQAEEPQDVPATVTADSELPDFEQNVSLSVTVGKDRRLRVTLKIDPLPAWTEEQMWLLPASAPEQKAGRIAEALRAAADQLAQDAPIKYAIRQNEEAKAKERYAARA